MSRLSPTLRWVALCSLTFLIPISCGKDERRLEQAEQGGVQTDAGGSAGALISVGMGGNPACVQHIDPTSYDFDLEIEPSVEPPGGLAVEDVPQFIALGWDDNFQAAGMAWTIDMLAERGLKSTFFNTTAYQQQVHIKEQWRRALEDGHETANHTVNHPSGHLASIDDWRGEVLQASADLVAPYEADVLSGLGLAPGDLFGFRSPHLHYNDSLFPVLLEAGIWYDASIEDGYNPAVAPGEQPWPYTLHGGSPGHDFVEGGEFRDFEVGDHPGILELPVYVLEIPPDSQAAQYGFEEGLRERVGVERITGLDFNMWMAGMSGAEFLATLKYNLDLRLAGNRAPFLFTTHTHIYHGSWRQGVADGVERQEAMTDFIDYAISHEEVRFVPYKTVFDFMREPRPLDCY